MKVSIVVCAGLLVFLAALSILPASIVLMAAIALGLVVVGLIERNFDKFIYWLWAPWVLSLTPSLAGFLNYYNPPISLGAMAYVLCALLACSLTYMCFSSSNAQKFSMSAQLEIVMRCIQRDRRLITVLSILGLIGAAAFTFEMVFVINVSFEDLFALRTQFETREVSLLSRIAPLLGWGAWVSLSAAIIGWSILGYRERLLWLVSPLALTLLSVLSAGRQVVFLTLIMAMLAMTFRSMGLKIASHSLLISRGRSRIGLVSKTFAGILVVVAVVYMGSIAAFRNDAQNLALKSDYLLETFAATSDPQAREAFESLPQAFEDAVYEGMIYFSSGTSLFSGFFRIDDEAVFGGTFSFPWISRRIEMLTGVPVVEAMSYRESLMYSAGYMGHGWSTAFASYILDFGKFGAIMFIMAFGALAARAFSNFNLRPSLYRLLLIFAVKVHCFYLILLPATSDSLYFFFVLGVALLTLLHDVPQSRRNAALNVSIR